MSPFFKKKEQGENASNGAKKKGIKKYLIIGAAGVIVALLIVRNITSKNAPIPVTTDTVMKGDIEVVVSISGNIASDETKTYYATVSAPLDTFEFKKGDRVEKGDVLYAYDAEDLENEKKKAELNLAQANGNYSGSIEKNNKATDVLVGNSIHDINTRLDEITAEIDDINNKITEKTTRMNRTLTDLQKVSGDVDENGISDSYDVTDKNNAPNERTAENGNQMSLEIQNAIAEVQYALQNDPEIQEWNRQITALNEEKAKLSEQASVEQSRLTSGEKSAMEAQREISELESSSSIKDIEEVEGGVKADFGGVVTEVDAEKGMTTTPGTKLLTIESTDDVRVDIQISKSDIPKIALGQKVDITVNGSTYEGEVAQISGAATNNSSGVPVVNAQIKIKNPDDKIILGVEASNKIHTDKAEGVLVLPFEYIGTDSEGDYVYVIENGVLVRKNVTLGLTNSTDAQIEEGLSEGDEIVTTDISTLEAGTKVGAVKD